MANLDDMQKKINEMHTAIIQQKTLIDNAVVSKDACETKRKEIFETIQNCAETQCEKIEKAGKLSKTASIIAGVVGSIAALLVALVVYLLTRGT